MAAVLLASLAGILFGAFAVALRLGLRRYGDAEVGALASVVAAFGVGAIAALVSFEGPDRTADLWPYLVGGVLAPGVSQHLYVIAVRDIGSSRAGIVVGAAPLLSALVAIVFLDEPVRAAIVVGTLLIVAGGALLAGERDRPMDFKAVGALVVFALVLLRRSEMIGRRIVAAAALVVAGGIIIGIWF